ncbi:Lrp/AsnC family transcriptional regulator [Microbacterium sp. EYE_5]|uniref:Lrp/AsnC family transcriptional regulator n=1 Tax=unclassified Microbacterium TaxID=2609290 RepID=UPI0020050EA7|nr:MULTISPECIES: Lrp/AsnC family transcriptional regulator [unclassified Microbacterium]MCK6081828.1 Lrp/AsnC family transcriptional regulator [Microbacterium sp. EYE_382]MCK6087098.1 Lrp/AsnC family transcriptional regulator [Microbacterium sp. EYE_384]MCK6124924.1 Lrp/AsnC family transcriptional regulator [Microbacterium sp. EYE_80]MCK6127861.1 Lrp/AsnC family transcriptional regulator [Microbacterium sp. EYE_79]MCK6142782.1 Lrp/AsnC family transcriptional regulator [Microbacterium sp. EYE_3
MSTSSALPAKDLRPRDELDEVDRAIVGILAADGRISNAELAARVGVAPSTAHARTRGLIDRGVITGFHASVDQRIVGAGLQAMVHVTLRPGSRHESIVEFAHEVRGLPQVIQVFFLGGSDDFLIHIAVADSSDVRTFVVEHLSAQRSVANTRTSIIFDYHRNRVAAPFH